MATLHAQPYDLHAAGFYFATLETYRVLTKGHLNEFGQPVEEYEIQFIDGSEEECAFASLSEPTQANLDSWFEDLEQYEGLDEREQAAVAYLMDVQGHTLNLALEKADDVFLFEGSVLDYAHGFIDDCYDLEEKMGELARYFNYEAFARDLEAGGDVATFEHAGTHYVITNACEL